MVHEVQENYFKKVQQIREQGKINKEVVFEVRREKAEIKREVSL